jgi:hypothetical protein
MALLSCYSSLARQYLLFWALIPVSRDNTFYSTSRDSIGNTSKTVSEKYLKSYERDPTVE